MNMLYDEPEGHDALIENIGIDTEGRTVTIRFQAYPTEADSKRIPIAIEFTEVISTSVNTDLRQLTDNKLAGNVVYWRIASDAGTSYFYLTGGFIAVTAGLPPRLVRL